MKRSAPPLWDRLPFAARLFVTASLALLVAGGVMLYLSAHRDAQDAAADLRTQLAVELANLPPALSELVVIGDFATIQQTLDYQARRPNIVHVEYRDTSGAALLSEDAAAENRAPRWFKAWLALGDLTGEAAVEVGGRRYGTLAVVLSPQIAINRAWSRLVQHLSVLLLAVALDFLGIWLILRGGLRPLKALEAGTLALGRGELAARIDPEGSPELRRTITTFNEMAARIGELLGSLRDSEERWQFALEGSGNAVWDLDLARDRVFYSPSWLALLGLAPGEIGEASGEWRRRVHPDDAAEVMQKIAGHLSGESASYAAEYRIRHQAGHYLWVLDRGMVMARDEAGRPLRVIGTLSDISDRQQAQERVRLTASVFEHTHDGVVITDAAGTIIEVNDAFTEQTGYPREELLGHSTRLLRSGLHDDAFYAELWRTLRRTGSWQGELHNRRKNGDLVVDLVAINAVRDARGQLTHFVGIYTDITQLKESQQRLEHLAHYDPLTRLPNRVLLADRLQQALARARRQGGIVAVCYLDLDGFKPINDQYGHAVGDQLLIEVAARMRDLLRGSDTVSRLGGDEFVLLLTELRQVDDLDRVLPRLLTRLAEPVLVDDRELRVAASIGVTIYPHDGGDPDTLLRHADQAMYLAKEQGRANYRIFDPHENLRARGHREAQQAVRRGLEGREFLLYYQPKLDARERRVVGMEALIRWQHPERGLLAPAHFLPGIEESELMEEVDHWVLGEAMAQMAAWAGQGLRLPVSVNISARTLQRAGLEQWLIALLERHPEVPAEWIELEILESAALGDIRHVEEVISACSRLGVRFALDDFGTGYSSLTYLKRLPAHVLKIDRSFIANMLDDPGDRAIVEGVLGLAEAFQRTVVAEGVEAAVQARLLLELGCHLVQGYGIAPPMPGPAVERWMEQPPVDESWGIPAAGSGRRAEAAPAG